MKRLLAGCLAVLTVAAVLPAVPTSASAQSRASLPMGAGTQLINLPRGSSMAVDLPADARDVIVPNPVVAEAMLHSPRRITIIGLQPGETDAVVLDASGRTILSLRVRVDAGVSALQDTLGRVMPGSRVQAEAVNDSIILTGPVGSPGEADRATQVARAFVSAPEKVINMMTIAGSDQVMVKARVVEVQRSAIRQLGLSTNVVINDGNQSYGLGRSNTYGVNGSSLGGSGLCYGQTGRTQNNTSSNGQTINTQSGNSVTEVVEVQGPGGTTTTTTTTSGGTTGNVISNLVSSAFQAVLGTNANACLQAFERAGLVRTLAEPNLTSVNGEDAEFLAGGEFPVPTGRDNDGNIQITFKPYGVRLAFRPIVLSEGRISLQLSTEVSELSTQGAFTLGGSATNALVIPALSVRRTSNTVELPSGGSLMIAGMLKEDTRQTIDQLPGIGNLPVLGSLFRSRDYLSGETELVIIVEAYIVSPTSPSRLQTPADGLQFANDAQTILLGQMERHFSPDSTVGGPSETWVGPVGYVIE